MDRKMSAGLKNARFVVTSRATGYRKIDGIELEIPHLRADIMDFSPRQQIKKADQHSQTIIRFLNKEENKTVRELAAVPMLLQIMAIIWKNRQYLPGTRVQLYEVALN